MTTTASVNPVPAVPRIQWLDAAKGIGILFVVMGHALGGVIDSPLGNGLDSFRAVFLGIYFFHMPLFFMLSGLFVAERIERGQIRFVRAIGKTIVWPYFLWSVIQFTVIFAMGSLVNRPAENYWSTILALPWHTVSQFWFLYALFWLHVAAIAIVPRIGRENLLLLALAAKALVVVIAPPFAVKLVFNNALFYALGVLFGAGGAAALVNRYSAVVKAFVLPPIALGTILITYLALPRFAADIPLAAAGSPDIANIAWRFPVLAAAVAGTIATIGLASLRPIARSKFFTFLGQKSMPIFLLHVLFVAGGRILLLRFGHVSNAYVLLAILVPLGVVGPLIVDDIAARLRLSRILGFA